MVPVSAPSHGSVPIVFGLKSLDLCIDRIKIADQLIAFSITQLTYLTDGTSVRMSKNDDAIVTTHPDGRIETADGKGVTTILDPNDGSVTVRDDKSGETTVFQRNGSWSTRDRNDKVISSGVTSDSEEPHL